MRLCHYFSPCTKTLHDCDSALILTSISVCNHPDYLAFRFVMLNVLVTVSETKYRQLWDNFQLSLNPSYIIFKTQHQSVSFKVVWLADITCEFADNQTRSDTSVNDCH